MFSSFIHKIKKFLTNISYGFTVRKIEKIDDFCSFHLARKIILILNNNKIFTFDNYPILNSIGDLYIKTSNIDKTVLDIFSKYYHHSSNSLDIFSKVKPNMIMVFSPESKGHKPYKTYFLIEEKKLILSIDQRKSKKEQVEYLRWWREN